MIKGNAVPGPIPAMAGRGYHIHLGAIEYVSVTMTMDFQKPVRIDTYPGFVLRSVLGMQLKRMHCAMRDSPCGICPFRITCAYSFIFESPIAKTTASLQGRDRASHPFLLWTGAIPGSLVNRLEFQARIFGKAREYLPHIVYAFREAALAGLFRSRTPATLSSVTIYGVEVLHGDRLMLDNLPRMDMILDHQPGAAVEKEVQITCLSPLRFKTEGRYSTDFSGSDFLASCIRRAFTMFEHYGELKPEASDILIAALRTARDSESPTITNRNLRWVEFPHYSGRQRSAMQLGGSMGSFRLSGAASGLAWSSLECCSILGAGKSGSFGYGSILLQNISEKE